MSLSQKEVALRRVGVAGSVTRAVRCSPWCARFCHLHLRRSRYYAFFQALARCCRHLLIISPTKNKGLVEAMHGWEEAEYLTEQKVHARFYHSLFAD